MTDQLGFPTRVEYNTSIANHKVSFKHPMLREAVPLRASNGTYIIGGGASAEVMANGLSIILGDSDVRSVFVNVFGGITACDAVANGIVQALDMLGSKATKPIVVRLDGNNVELGRKILNDANHPLVEQLETMDGAAAKAAELAAK